MRGVMHGDRTLLVDLALVLCVAAVTTVVFRKLRQPVVLGYVLAGLIVGPHVPVPLFADAGHVRTLSELGVVLVMFSVGLEFSIRRLVRVLPSAGPAGLVQLSVMLWLGYLAGQSLGWSARESLFCGAMVAISSTMIVAKVFAEQGVRGKVSDLVFGLLLVQDLAAVLLLALLTALSSEGGLSGAALAISAGRLVAFLLALVIAGFFVVPRAIRFVASLRSPETLLVSSIGLSFALALLAQALGYSVALGAFLAGSLVAESGEAPLVERLVRPVRDVFAAVFFVSVGMAVDPGMIAENWIAVVLLTAVVLVGQVCSVSLGCFLGGSDVRTSIQAGMSLAQIGEFSFIIAGVGIGLGAIRESMYPVAVAVSAVTTFATPWLIRASGSVALHVDRRLPKPLQTFVALYGGWFERLRTSRREEPRERPARILRLLCFDAVAIAVIVIGTSLSRHALLGWTQSLGVSTEAALLIVVALAGAMCAPFVIGIFGCARALGHTLTVALLPTGGEGNVDLAPAPPRALLVTVQIGIVLLVGLPLVALTQPFVPALWGGAVLAVLLGVLGIAFWRGAEGLQAHVRAGAQIIVEALVRQAGDPRLPTLDDVQPLLPALGDLTPVRLEESSPAVGATLAQLNLRGLTGATVIAITRGTQGIVPSASEVLARNDCLALAGTHEAVEAARRLLLEGPAAVPVRQSLRPRNSTPPPQ